MAVRHTSCMLYIPMWLKGRNVQLKCGILLHTKYLPYPSICLASKQFLIKVWPQIRTEKTLFQNLTVGTKYTYQTTPTNTS